MRATIHLVSAADFWPLADASGGPRLAGFLRVQRSGLGPDALRVAAQAAKTALRHGPLRQNDLDELVDKAVRRAIGL